MYPKPKPQKGAKRKANEKRKRELAAYRKEQRALAIERDEGGCRFCEVARGTDVHHAYGRGRQAEDWREHFSNLITTCQSCHPAPIYVQPPKPHLEYVVELLDKINTEPRKASGQPRAI